MRFKKFGIENYKGIRKAELILTPSGANVATLIGLNESGKTTILEAISRFSQSNDEQALYDEASEDVSPNTFVPKDQKSNFSDEIRITARVSMSTLERANICARFEEISDCKISEDSIPLEFDISRKFYFNDSDYKKAQTQWSVFPKFRQKGKKTFKHLKSSDNPAIWRLFAESVRPHIPEIAYFPTFLFTQPERVILNPGDDEEDVNRLYRQIIENIAKSLPRPLDIQKHVVDRIVSQDLGQKVLSIWGLAPDKQEQIAASTRELSAHLTDAIFSTWSKIFGGNFSGREIELNIGVDVDSARPLVYMQFSFREGTSKYNIVERSLGFRWFFSFLLFTLYRSSHQEDRPTLFLLDEPASNLHSRAQMQLLESFPRISRGHNQIIYSTHSHYLINPDWLDQAFIVSNSAIDYDDILQKGAITAKRATDISVERYRSFVGRHPDKITYFQPVLDKLEVVPSRIDLIRPSVIVEGKGDYRIISYGFSVLGLTPGFSIVPTRGNTGMFEIAGLFLGWGLPFAVCLDDDRAGNKTKLELVEDWSISPDFICTLGDLSPTLEGCSIEGFLDQHDLKIVSSHFGIETAPTKSQIQLFFSEMLATRKHLDLSEHYRNSITAFYSRFNRLFPPP